jgi:hypothetical protein
VELGGEGLRDLAQPGCEATMPDKLVIGAEPGLESRICKSLPANSPLSVSIRRGTNFIGKDSERLDLHRQRREQAQGPSQ